MDFSGYAQVWRVPAVRQAVILGALGKAPWFGATMVLTLHVVGRLGETYSAAGLVSAAFTIALAVSSPWRGRMLDHVGLRRTIGPSLVVVPLAFIAAPWLPYWVLLLVVAGVGLVAVPWFVLTRQVLMAAVPVEQRRTVMALDSIITEVAFMVGPALGILAATYGDTRWALPLFACLSIAAAVVLWLRNPALKSEDAPEPEVDAHPRRRFPAWWTASVSGVFLMNAAATFILSGQDLAIVAAYRGFDAQWMLAAAMIAWPLGSLVGGIVYGALPEHHIPLWWLVGALAVTTIPNAFAPNPWLLLPLIVLCGIPCAPAIAAIMEQLSHEVPEGRRGVAMGWSGSFSTIGSAASPPLIGLIMDHQGWAPGFIWTGVLGVLFTAIAAAMVAAGRGAVRPRSSRARAGLGSPNQLASSLSSRGPRVLPCSRARD